MNDNVLFHKLKIKSHQCSLCGLHVLSMFANIFSGYVSFLLQSKNMLFGELHIVCESVCVFCDYLASFPGSSPALCCLGQAPILVILVCVPDNKWSWCIMNRITNNTGKEWVRFVSVSRFLKSLVIPDLPNKLTVVLCWFLFDGTSESLWIAGKSLNKEQRRK